MTRAEANQYCNARVPGVCPVPECGSSPDEQGGNGWFCATHYAEICRMMIDENTALRAAQAAKRSAAAKAAAETRRLKDGSVSRDGKRITVSFAAGVAGQRKNAEIRSKYARRMGWA